MEGIENFLILFYPLLCCFYDGQPCVYYGSRNHKQKKNMARESIDHFFRDKRFDHRILNQLFFYKHLKEKKKQQNSIIIIIIVEERLSLLYNNNNEINRVGVVFIIIPDVIRTLLCAHPFEFISRFSWSFYLSLSSTLIFMMEEAIINNVLVSWGVNCCWFRFPS